jgi:hypothetical protein
MEAAAKKFQNSVGRSVAHAKFTAVRHHVGRVGGCRGHAAGGVFLLPVLVSAVVDLAVVVVVVVVTIVACRDSQHSRQQTQRYYYCHGSPAAGAGWYTGTSGFDTASPHCAWRRVWRMA